MLRLAPSILCSSRHVLRPAAVVSHRQFGSQSEQQLPGFVKPIFEYASDAYGTQAIQVGIEGKLKFGELNT
jgi:hypothetical protein